MELKKWFPVWLAAVYMTVLTACGVQVEIVVDPPPAVQQGQVQENPQEKTAQQKAFSLEDVPAYSGDAYVAVNNNIPYFKPEEIKTESFEVYSELDELGRCGVAYACIGQDLMPTEARESIGSVKPSGWQSTRYDDLVDGKYLYNRCHLIGFQLTGENANKKNLITGTRYLNIDGMLGFENMVADYIKETENHVMFRVTPVFVGEELVARGVLMEGYSVEDAGEELCFCVYAYNVQPGVEIDYATGKSELGEKQELEGVKLDYVLNTKSEKFHYPSCKSIEDINQDNMKKFSGTRQELITRGYEPCGRCKP